MSYDNLASSILISSTSMSHRSSLTGTWRIHIWLPSRVPAKGRRRLHFRYCSLSRSPLSTSIISLLPSKGIQFSVSLWWEWCSKCTVWARVRRPTSSVTIKPHPLRSAWCIFLVIFTTAAPLLLNNIFCWRFRVIWCYMRRTRLGSSSLATSNVCSSVCTDEGDAADGASAGWLDNLVEDWQRVNGGLEKDTAASDKWLGGGEESEDMGVSETAGKAEWW
jgi:hypothetical protein